MQTKNDVLAALERRLPEPMNMGVVGTSIVVVMNMDSELGANMGLMVVAEAVNTAIEAATAALGEIEQARGQRRH